MTKGQLRDEIMKQGVNVDVSLFTELTELIGNNEIKSQSHKGYVFSYLWLNSYLWRYEKHYQENYTIKEIKSLLGRSPIDKTIDYITKKNGLLDSKKYTEYTTDFPIYAGVSEERHFVFTYLSDLDEDTKKSIKAIKPRGYYTKKPLQGYSRGGKEGLFFSKDDIVELTIGEFNKCLSHEEVGVDGFYVYAWVKMKSKLIHKKRFALTYKEMTRELGFSASRIRDIMKSLNQIDLVETHSRTFRDNETMLPVTRNEYEIKGIK